MAEPVKCSSDGFQSEGRYHLRGCKTLMKGHNMSGASFFPFIVKVKQNRG